MLLDWDNEKNEILKSKRNISFERMVVEIESGEVLDILKHPNKTNYPNQIMIILNIYNYAWVVPTNEKSESLFLKTALPSRNYTKLYLSELKPNEN